MKLSAESICFRHLFPWCNPNLGGWNGIVAAGTIAASSVSIVVALENNENGVN